MITHKDVLLCLGCLLVVAAACGSSHTGVIDGTYYGTANRTSHVGGVPSAGTILVSGPAGTFTATAGGDGRFSVAVPAGTYVVSGRASGQTGGISGCQDAGVRVTAGQTAHIAVTCMFH